MSLLTTPQKTLVLPSGPLDTVVPTAPTIAAVKAGVCSELIGVERPGSHAGWDNVNKITVQVDTVDGTFSSYNTMVEEGELIVSRQFTWISPVPCHAWARAKATNIKGDSAWSTTITFDTSTAKGDTDVPGQVTDFAMQNCSDDAKIKNGEIRAIIAWQNKANNKALWQVVAQFHNSSTMKNPEDPGNTPNTLLYSPGTRKGSIVRGGTTFIDAGADFVTAAVGAYHWLMCSYDDPFPSSYPAARTFLAMIQNRDSATQFKIFGIWSQPTGDYTYRVVTRQELLDSGRDAYLFTLVMDEKSRDVGSANINFKCPTPGDWYARFWLYNTFGRSIPSASSSAKAGMVAPNGTIGTLGAPAVTVNDDGSVDLRITWYFTQGTIVASGFEVLMASYASGLGAITEGTADKIYKVAAMQAAGSNYHTFFLKGVNPTSYYSFAIRSYVEINGCSIKGTLTDTASWRSVQPATQPSSKNFKLLDGGSVVSYDPVAGKEVLTWVSRMTISVNACDSTYPTIVMYTPAHGLAVTPVHLAYKVLSAHRYALPSLLSIYGDITGPMLATIYNANWIGITGANWVTNQFKGFYVRIVDGTGKGQRRGISSSSSTSLVVDSSFSTTPDNTSVFVIENVCEDLACEVDDTYVFAYNRAMSSQTMKVYLFKETAAF